MNVHSISDHLTSGALFGPVQLSYCQTPRVAFLELSQKPWRKHELEKCFSRSSLNEKNHLRWGNGLLEKKEKHLNGVVKEDFITWNNENINENIFIEWKTQLKRWERSLAMLCLCTGQCFLSSKSSQSSLFHPSPPNRPLGPGLQGQSCWCKKLHHMPNIT